jgi:ubiquinone/menaquinone biosynthesis C-methylase UbiE
MKNQTLNIPHTCPRWLLFAFDNPIRTAMQRPKELLKKVIQPGDVVLDVGCGTGYLSLPAAEITGQQGKVIAADLQAEMLYGLQEKAEKKGLSSRIQLLQTAEDHIGVMEPVDVVLAFWMVHEVRDQKGFLSEIYQSLKPGKSLFLVEPRIHVGQAAFEKTVALAESVGYKVVEPRRVFFSRAMLLRK